MKSLCWSKDSPADVGILLVIATVQCYHNAQLGEEGKMKLNELTKAQKNKLPKIREKWIEIGLHTGPGSLKTAWDGIRKAYVSGGRKEPTFWVWMESPYRAVIACATLRQVRDQVRDQVRAQVSDQVFAQVSAQV